MTITYHAGRRIQGLDSDLTATQLPSGSVGGWVELARTTLGSDGDDITVSSLADKRYYMYLVNTKHDATGGFERLQFGNSSIDTGSNYAIRRSNNGGTDQTYGSQTSGIIGVNTGANEEVFGVGYVANYSSKEKLNINHSVNGSTAGAGTAPIRAEQVNKWTNTSNPLDIINIYNNVSGAFTSGSELVVLGYDPSDTHTTNFWQELADVSWSSGGTIDTGTFTAKKYLWVQAGFKGNSGTYTRFNNDSGANYSWRYSNNGGGDSTQTSITGIQSNFGYGTNLHFLNYFIINNASTEKLVISHMNYQETVGAGNAPSRSEQVHKWVNTSNQITSIKFQAGSGNYTGGFIKVWGAD